MPEKSHLKFLNENKFLKLRISNIITAPSLTKMKTAFLKIILGWQLLSRKTLKNLTRDIKSKYRTKDQSLNIPYDIDFILITFQGTFPLRIPGKNISMILVLKHLLSTISVEKDYLPLQIVKNSRHSSPTFTTLLNMNWKEIKLFNIQAI